MSSTLAVMTLTAVMTLPAFDPATPKVSILSIGDGTIDSARQLVDEAEKQTAEFQSVATTKAGFMLTNYCSLAKPCTVSSCPRTRQMLSSRTRQAQAGRPHTRPGLACAQLTRTTHDIVHPRAVSYVMHHTMQATKCTIANGAGVRLEFIEAGSIGLLHSYKPPLILEPGEVASFLVSGREPFQLNYNIETFQGPFGGWLDGDTNKAVTVTSSTKDRPQIDTVVQVDRGTTKYPSQIFFDVSTTGDSFNIVAKQLIDTEPSPPEPPYYMIERGFCGARERECKGSRDYDESFCGAALILTKTECDAAATALGLSDTTAYEVPTWFTSSSFPPGCSSRRTSPTSSSLFVFADREGARVFGGSCSSSKRCICKSISG